MIRNIIAITERELRSYFVSPVAWVVTAFFVAIWGILFFAIVTSGREAVLRPLLSNFSITFLFVGPFLTMRLIAEEAKTGTLELLLTQPIREVELVVGKYLASLGFLAFMLAVTLYFPTLLEVFGDPDRGPMMAGYLGILLQGMAFMAIGLIASSLTQNQIIAAAVTFVVLLLLWLADVLTLGGAAAEVARFISISQRSQDMLRGVVDTKDVVFFFTVIVGCLFVTTQIISARRWR
ncbi:MAG: ABC transporter permease [Chloroflexi bacterium]|nr:ABC transporter permease [Chloroflexota bacterium]